MSFRFNPATDSYLVVPGAMQTILINAYCICRELQGVLVQAYVQWIIQDFATAYRKLDFCDPEDPMRLVNLQLKEQAEAAIKDKVATMSVHEVLSDKQPIIEELTARLRARRRGRGRQRRGAWACGSSPCRSRKRWSARRGCGRTCRSRSGPSRSAWPGWPNWRPRRRSPSRELGRSRTAGDPAHGAPTGNWPSCGPATTR